MKITTIDRPTMKAIRDILDRALESVKDELANLGVGATAGNARFSARNATFKVDFGLLGEGGEVVSREAEDFKRYATLFGLTPDDLGKTVTLFNGHTYKIEGLKMKSRLYPIFASRNGKMFKLPANAVARVLHPETK